jgi:outer membrane protein insertion porin family
MHTVAAFALVFTLAVGAEGPFDPAVSAPPVVRSVVIRGAKAPVTLATQVGQPYNARFIALDVHTLWNMGRFEDIRVEAAPQGDGTAVMFHVVEARPLLLRKVLIEPSNFGLKLSIPEGAPVDRQRAQAFAREARKQLAAQGYLNAQVNPELVPLTPGTADLHLTVAAGDRIHVTETEFTGDGVLDSSELRQSLRALRIRHIFGWRLLPGYSREAVDADLARVDSLYLSKGYLDANVRLENAEIQGKNAVVRIRADAGPLYQLKQRPCEVCASLLRERREAESRGILDFSAMLRVRGESLDAMIDRGEVYRVGRIEFSGNHHYSDATLRRNLLIEEGQLLDGRLLRKSIDRLNRSKLFEPIDASQVLIHPGGAKGVADVRVKLTELKRGSWRISGPAGPPSFAGSLEASLKSRLPPWGSGLFELATYTASVSVFAFAHPILPLLAIDRRRKLLTVLALSRPFSPGEGWESGFSIAPELGWRASALGYSLTQMQQRLLPVLAGGSGLVPELPVTVEGPSREGVMLCEPAPPRFAKLRYGGTIVLRILSVFTGI